jgi:drug/metabolite transporter (DMT)-like permease
VKSRRIALLVVLLTSQGVGLVLITAVVLAAGTGPPAAGIMLVAALGSIAGIAGLAAFYRGLVVGAMGVVAPISATAAAIPVAVGLAGGERPSTLQVVGMLVVLVGVVLASREAGGTVGADGRSARVAAGAGLALVAALGFGTFFVVVDYASEADPLWTTKNVPNPLWTILAARATGVVLLSTLLAAGRRRVALDRRDAPGLIAIGAFDVAANTMFALASTQGLLSVVAVLASLYPVATIILARVVLGERVRAVQRTGALGALAGVVLITAG